MLITNDVIANPTRANSTYDKLLVKSAPEVLFESQTFIGMDNTAGSSFSAVELIKNAIDRYFVLLTDWMYKISAPEINEYI